MAFVIETGLGIENANAYVSVEFADGYNSSQIDGQEWSYLDPGDKQIRIITATQIIDQNFDFDGRRLTHIQALEFPRYGLRDRGGFIMPTAPLPRFLKCATSELARILGERFDTSGTSTGTPATTTSGGVEKIQVGPIALTLASASAGSSGTTAATAQKVPAIPRSVVSWLLAYSTPRFGYGSAKLVR